MIKSNLMSKAIASSIGLEDWLYVVLGDDNLATRDKRIQFKDIEKSILGEGSVTLTELKNDDMFYIVKTSDNNLRTKVNVGTIIEKAISKYDAANKAFDDADTIIVVDKDLAEDRRFQIKIGDLRKSFEDGMANPHFRTLAVGAVEDTLVKFLQVDIDGNLTIGEGSAGSPYMKFIRDDGININDFEMFKGNLIIKSGSTTGTKPSGFFQIDTASTNATTMYLENETDFSKTTAVVNDYGFNVTNITNSGTFITKGHSKLGAYSLTFSSFDVLNSNNSVSNNFIISNTPKFISISVGSNDPLRYKGEYNSIANGTQLYAGDVVRYNGHYRCARIDLIRNGSATLPGTSMDTYWYGYEQFVYFQTASPKFTVDNFGVAKFQNFTIDNYKVPNEFSIIELDSTDNLEGYQLADWNSILVGDNFYKYNVFLSNNSYWQSTNANVGLYGSIQKLPSTPAPGMGSGVWARIEVTNKRSFVVTKTDVRTGMKFTAIEGIPFDQYNVSTSGFASTLSPRSLEIISGSRWMGNFDLTKITSNSIEMKQFIGNATVETRSSGILSIGRTLIKLESEGDFYGTGGISYHISSKTDNVIDGKKYSSGFVARSGFYDGVDSNGVRRVFGEVQHDSSGIRFRHSNTSGTTFVMDALLHYGGFTLYNDNTNVKILDILNKYNCGNVGIFNSDGKSFGEFGGDEYAGGFLVLSSKKAAEDFSRTFLDTRIYTITDNEDASGAAIRMFGGIGTKNTDALVPYKTSKEYFKDDLVAGYDEYGEPTYAICTATSLQSSTDDINEAGWSIVTIVDYNTKFIGIGEDGQVLPGNYGPTANKLYLYNGKLYRALLPAGTTYGYTRVVDNTYTVMNEWWYLQNLPGNSPLSWETLAKWEIEEYPSIVLTTRKNDVLTNIPYDNESESDGTGYGGNGIFKIYASNNGGKTSKRLAFSIHKNTLALYDYSMPVDGYRQNLITISGMYRYGSNGLEGDTTTRDKEIFSGISVYSRGMEEHVTFRVPLYDKVHNPKADPVLYIEPESYNWEQGAFGGYKNGESVVLQIKRNATSQYDGVDGTCNLTVDDFFRIESVSKITENYIKIYTISDFTARTDNGKAFSNISEFRCNIRKDLGQRYFQMEIEFNYNTISGFLAPATGYGTFINLMRFDKVNEMIKTSDSILGSWAVLDSVNHSTPYGNGCNLSGIAVMDNSGHIVLTTSSAIPGFPNYGTLVVQFNT